MPTFSNYTSIHEDYAEYYEEKTDLGIFRGTGTRNEIQNTKLFYLKGKVQHIGQSRLTSTL